MTKIVIGCLCVACLAATTAAIVEPGGRGAERETAVPRDEIRPSGRPLSHTLLTDARERENLWWVGYRHAVLKEQKRVEAERQQAQAVRAPAPVVPQSEVERIICAAAAEFRVDCGRMIRIARCESGMNPANASNPRHYGLFQQNREYWPGRVAEFNDAVDPDAGTDPYSASNNARVSAWMMAAPGGFGHWECKG